MPLVAPTAPRWGLVEVVTAYLAGIFLAVVAASIAVQAGAGTTDPVTTTVSFVGEWVGFVGGPVWLSRKRGTGRLSTDFGLRIELRDVVVGLGAAFALVAAISVYTTVLHHFDHANLEHEAQQLAGHGLGASFIVFAVCAGIGAPIAEELFFRGLAQPALQRYLRGWGGLIATAILFGLAHLGGNPVEAIPPLALVGLAVGYLAWRTGRLGPGIVTHMAFNGVTIVSLALKR